MTASNREPVEETPTLAEVVDQCRAGKDESCAAYLSEARYWNALLGTANEDWSAFESACRGGHGTACGIVEQMEKQASYDDVSTKRMLAAIDELAELEKQWVKQLATLSQLKCATGEQDSIAAEWAKGQVSRDEKLAHLDEVAAEVGPTAQGGSAWPPLREQFTLRMRAALAAALGCKLGLQ